MKKQSLYFCQIVQLILAAFALSYLISCSTLSSGKKYTLAKVDRNKLLIEPHRVLEKLENNDVLDEINPTDVLSLVLNAGCLPYLQEVGRPEVVIFVTTKIRQKNKPEEELLWEKVYLNSEDPDGYSVVNKDSCLPKKDIVILPPIIYDNQDILVSIRIIEMDSADNERMNAMVATAASVAATFQSQYAGAISVFQSVLNLIIANNADDIEFQYDFTISESEGPVEFNKNSTGPSDNTDQKTEFYDMVINPRIGKYAIIKTEHRARQIIPFGYADTAQSGIRYGSAEILKFATLGILNWTMWCDIPNKLATPPESLLCNYMDLKDPDDIYHKILGRPFAPERDAFIPPVYNENGVLTSQGEQKGKFEIIGDNIKIRQESEAAAFERQAYLILSVVAGRTGLDIATLQTVANQKKLVAALNLNTAQLGNEELKTHMQPVLNSIQIFEAKKQIREDCTARINYSGTPEQVNSVQKDCEQKIQTVKDNYSGESETKNIALESTLRDIQALASQKIRRLQTKSVGK